MKKKLATYASCLALASVLFSACSRPVAYFQRGSVAHYEAARPVPAGAENALPVAQPASAVESVATVAVPVNLSAQPTQALDQLDAYVRNDSKLASTGRLSKHLDRIKTLLATPAVSKQLSSAPTEHKATAMERLMVKKLNKKISRHLSPNQPNKPMINGGLLTGSLILVLAGVLLLLLTTGTAATIGVVAAIIGAIGLIFGLLAS